MSILHKYKTKFKYSLYMIFEINQVEIPVSYTHLITLLTPALFYRLAPWNGWIINMAESLLIVIISCIIVWCGRRIPGIRRLLT